MSAENRLESPRSATDGPRATWREWLGLAVIALPCMLYSMDLTVLELALPRISAELQPSGAGLLWIVDIYGFFVAGLLITMGNVGDRIGRRRLLLMGAAAFGVRVGYAEGVGGRTVSDDFTADLGTPGPRVLEFFEN